MPISDWLRRLILGEEKPEDVPIGEQPPVPSPKGWIRDYGHSPDPELDMTPEARKIYRESIDPRTGMLRDVVGDIVAEDIKRKDLERPNTLYDFPQIGPKELPKSQLEAVDSLMPIIQPNIQDKILDLGEGPVRPSVAEKIVRETTPQPEGQLPTIEATLPPTQEEKDALYKKEVEDWKRRAVRGETDLVQKALMLPGQMDDLPQSAVGQILQDLGGKDTTYEYLTDEERKTLNPGEQTTLTFARGLTGDPRGNEYRERDPNNPLKRLAPDDIGFGRGLIQGGVQNTLQLTADPGNWLGWEVPGVAAAMLPTALQGAADTGAKLGEIYDQDKLLTGEGAAALADFGGSLAQVGIMGHGIKEGLNDMYPREQPKFDWRDLTSRALDNDIIRQPRELNLPGDEVVGPNLSEITHERYERAKAKRNLKDYGYGVTPTEEELKTLSPLTSAVPLNSKGLGGAEPLINSPKFGMADTTQWKAYSSESPESRGRNFKDITDEELIALDRFTDGYDNTYPPKAIQLLREKLSYNMDWGEPDTLRFKLLKRIYNKLESIDPGNPALNKVLAYGYEGLKEVDPALLNNLAKITSNAVFEPDETTAPPDINYADMFVAGNEARKSEAYKEHIRGQEAFVNARRVWRNLDENQKNEIGSIENLKDFLDKSKHKLHPALEAKALSNWNGLSQYHKATYANNFDEFVQDFLLHPDSVKQDKIKYDIYDSWLKLDQDTKDTEYDNSYDNYYEAMNTPGYSKPEKNELNDQDVLKNIPNDVKKTALASWDAMDGELKGLYKGGYAEYATKYYDALMESSEEIPAEDPFFNNQPEYKIPSWAKIQPDPKKYVPTPFPPDFKPPAEYLHKWENIGYLGQKEFDYDFNKFLDSAIKDEAQGNWDNLSYGQKLIYNHNFDEYLDSHRKYILELGSSIEKDEPTESQLLSPSPYYKKGYADFKFKHSQPVKVTWPDGTVHYDEVKGLNQGHALHEARKNWEGAKVEPITAEELNANLDAETDLPTLKEEGQGLEPVEPLETVSMDELYPQDDINTGSSIATNVRKQSEGLLEEAFQSKVADAFTEALKERPKTQDIKLELVQGVPDDVSPENITSLATKTQEIASVIRSTLAKLGYIEPGDISLTSYSAVGSVSKDYLGTRKGNQTINPSMVGREVFVNLRNEHKTGTPEEIVNRYIDRIAQNVLHESGHLSGGWHDTGDRGNKRTGFKPDSPLVNVGELGDITDTGQIAPQKHKEAQKALETHLMERYKPLREMLKAVFKDQINAQDIIDIAKPTTEFEAKNVIPQKTPPDRITEEPDLMRMTEALTTGKDPGPSPVTGKSLSDILPKPTKSLPKPTNPADPIDHIAAIHSKLTRGDALPDFKTWSESLPDELKPKAAEIWREALGSPDDIIAKSTHPFKSLISLINARYPNGSKEAQAKILTKMITDSKFLGQDMKAKLLKNLPYQLKYLSGNPTAPPPTGNVPPRKTPPTPPPANPTPNRFVKSSTDWVKYNQAIPVRQDQVAQKFQHLPKGLANILAYEANPNMAPDLKDFFDNLYKEQKAAGVQVDYIEDYLHHAYEGTPEQLQKYREWLDSQGSRSITLKPGHTLHRMFDTYKEAMKFGLKPKFNNLADIAALYYGKARRAILDAELVNYLKTNIDPKTGEVMLQKVRRPGYSPIVNFPGSRVPTKNGYAHVEYYAPTEIATQINNFNSEAMTPLKILSGLASKARNLMLGAGIPGTWMNMHGLNIENRFAKSGVPDHLIISTVQGVGEAAKLLKDPTGRGLEDALSQSLDEIGTMIERGGVVIRPRKFYFDAVEKSLREVLRDTTGTGLQAVDEFAAKIPGGLELARKFGQTGQIIEHLFDKPLFERLVPYMMKQRYYEHLNNLLAQGMDEQQAHETAGSFVNTMFGANNWQASMNTAWNNPNTQALLQSIVLAPQWFGSNVKMMGKIPKSFFDNSPESKMYKGYAKKFMTLFILSQFLGAGGTGGSEFQIPAGDVDEEHERQIRPFGTAEDWIRLPFELLHKAYTRSDWDAAAKILRNRMHPFVRSGLELITGKDLYTGQALTGPSVPEGRKLLNIGKTITDPFRPAQVDATWELAKKLTPVGDWSEQNNLGRVKSLEEIAYDFTEAPVGVYKKQKPKSPPPFEPFNFKSRRKSSKKKKPKISL